MGPNGIHPLTRVLGEYPCDPISPFRPGSPTEVRPQGNGANRATIADPGLSCRRDARRGEVPVWGREVAALTCRVVSGAGTGPRRQGELGPKPRYDDGQTPCAARRVFLNFFNRQADRACVLRSFSTISSRLRRSSSRLIVLRRRSQLLILS